MGTVMQFAVITLSTVMMVHQCSSADPGMASSATSVDKSSDSVREKRVAESLDVVESGRMVRKKKASDSDDTENQLRALNEFLHQTRQLGVADSEALALLDKELAHAHLPSLKASLGHALPSRPVTPVYHATPLMPYGALHIPNARPYEKHKPAVTPIKEELHDTPPPKRPLVVDLPAPQHSSPQPTLSPEQLIALQSPGKVTEAIPIRSAAPAKSATLDRRKPPVKLFQPAEALVSHFPVSKASSPLPPFYHPIKTVKPVPLHHTDSGSDSDDQYEGYASRYRFGYRIRDPHSGSDFGHAEARDGERTEGNYHVLLPDGRIQSVRYWAGPTGFHASVSYSGQNQH